MEYAGWLDESIDDDDNDMEYQQGTVGGYEYEDEEAPPNRELEIPQFKMVPRNQKPRATVVTSGVDQPAKVWIPDINSALHDQIIASIREELISKYSRKKVSRQKIERLIGKYFHSDPEVEFFWVHVNLLNNVTDVLEQNGYEINYEQEAAPVQPIAQEPEPELEPEPEKAPEPVEEPPEEETEDEEEGLPKAVNVRTGQVLDGQQKEVGAILFDVEPPLSQDAIKKLIFSLWQGYQAWPNSIKWHTPNKTFAILHPDHYEEKILPALKLYINTEQLDGATLPKPIVHDPKELRFKDLGKHGKCIITFPAFYEDEGAQDNFKQMIK